MAQTFELTPPPLSLYVHVPWCVRKCPYCDFNSHPLNEALPEQAYVDALLADLDQELPLVWGRSLLSIFIGGGTPSLLSPDALDRLLGELRARFAFGPGIEVTLEANPGTVEQGRFAAFRAAGVNRLSIGIQSFDDRSLAAIGRIHNGAEAVRAIEAARGAGFDNLNLDLMYGLPGQTPEAAGRDLQMALAFAPEHLSYYQLTLEPHTAFGARPPKLPEEEALWQMHRQGMAQLEAAGLGRYEISAFARAGRQSRHNRNYWEFGDYLGIGAGAHGKRTEPRHGRIVRTGKHRHPRDYLDGAGTAGRIATEERLTPEVLPLEFMMNALRLTEGFDAELFPMRTGLGLAAVESALELAEARGLLGRTAGRIAPTERGRDHLDSLVALFVGDD